MGPASEASGLVQNVILNTMRFSRSASAAFIRILGNSLPGRQFQAAARLQLFDAGACNASLVVEKGD
jgi:hypothetical protein